MHRSASGKCSSLPRRRSSASHKERRGRDEAQAALRLSVSHPVLVSCGLALHLGRQDSPWTPEMEWYANDIFEDMATLTRAVTNLETEIVAFEQKYLEAVLWMRTVLQETGRTDAKTDAIQGTRTAGGRRGETQASEGRTLGHPPPSHGFRQPTEEQNGVLDPVGSEHGSPGDPEGTARAQLCGRYNRSFTSSQVSERVSSTSSSTAAGGSCLAQGLLLGGSSASSSGLRRKPAPLLRARTLPAIVTPSLCIIQAQLDAGTQPPVAAMTQQHRQRHAKKKQSQGDSRRGSPDKSDSSPPQSRLLTRRSPSGGALRPRDGVSSSPVSEASSPGSAAASPHTPSSLDERLVPSRLLEEHAITWRVFFAGAAFTLAL
ncbi:hypothetical protein MRX96_032426 [Rhipicephalus microplus]